MDLPRSDNNQALLLSDLATLGIPLLRYGSISSDSLKSGKDRLSFTQIYSPPLLKSA